MEQNADNYFWVLSKAFRTPFRHAFPCNQEIKLKVALNSFKNADATMPNGYSRPRMPSLDKQAGSYRTLHLVPISPEAK